MKCYSVDCALFVAQILQTTSPLLRADPHARPEFFTIAHDTSALIATRKLAEKIHVEDTRRLLMERRLSLIVDLDQTIVHAWDDPIIEQWLNEPTHPYHTAAKEIHRIVLHDNSQALYLKLRPGTREFLQNASKLFELHIYTAGSRSYANAVAQLLDPNGKLFAQRILSRDESGSQRTKDIKRLFPCDDAMVLIIDDRADVWNRVHNLIQVRKYEFYLGVGDINAAAATAKDKSSVKTDLEPSEQSAEAIEGKPSDSEVAATNAVPSEQQEAAQSDSGTANERAEEDLPKEDVAQKPVHSSATGNVRPVLDDTDKELDIIWDHLSNIHSAFYMLHDELEEEKQRVNEAFGERVAMAMDKVQAELDGQQEVAMTDDEKRVLEKRADVKEVTFAFRRRALAGCTVLFSGLIATNEDHLTNELWLMATECGAVCVTSLTPWVTHIVAAKPGTSKVNNAEDRGDVFIVTRHWLEESFYSWKRASERLHALSGTEQPTISIEDRIEQASKQLQALAHRPQGEGLTMKRGLDTEAASASFMQSSGCEVPASADDYHRKRTRTMPEDSEEDSLTDYREELAQLSPPSDTENLREKLMQSDWAEMMDDVLAELEEDGELLDTETDADGSMEWPDKTKSSESDDSNGNSPNPDEDNPAIEHSGSDLDSANSRNARTKQSRLPRSTLSTTQYQPSPLRFETSQLESSGAESDLESDAGLDSEMERRRKHRNPSIHLPTGSSTSLVGASTASTTEELHSTATPMDEHDDQMDSLSELEGFERELELAMDQFDDMTDSPTTGLSNVTSH